MSDMPYRKPPPGSPTAVTIQFTTGPVRTFHCERAEVLGGLLVLHSLGGWERAHTLKIVQWARMPDGSLLKGKDFRETQPSEEKP